MVGFRVFDVGLLVLWLVWFFRLRNDDAGWNDEAMATTAAGHRSTRPSRPAAAGWACCRGRSAPGAGCATTRVRQSAGAVAASR